MSEETKNINPNSKILEAHAQGVCENALRHHYEQFIERYIPEDPHKAARFQSDLFMLVGLIHKDATAPVLKERRTFLEGQLKSSKLNISK